MVTATIEGKLKTKLLIFLIWCLNCSADVTTSRASGITISDTVDGIEWFAPKFQPYLLAYSETTTPDGYDACCKLGTPWHTLYQSLLQCALLLNRHTQCQYLGMSAVSAPGHPYSSLKFPFPEYAPLSAIGLGIHSQSVYT